MTQRFVPECPFSVGKPNALTEVRIVGDDGRDVASGELGEIWLRSRAPKRLFLNAPEVNARLLADGWHRTGDLARFDERGEVQFFDRKVDTLSIRGKLVSSLELECLVLEHPAVREAAVVGVRQHAGDSQVVAFVALRDPSGLPTLQQFVAERVPPEHRPHRIISVMALPRTHNGKVLKRELRLDANIALSRQANGSGILHHDDAALRAPLLASSGSTKVLLP